MPCHNHHLPRHAFKNFTMYSLILQALIHKTAQRGEHNTDKKFPLKHRQNFAAPRTATKPISFVHTEDVSKSHAGYL